MKIIIIGAGKVGIQIAKTLSLEDNDITIIDQKENIRQEIDDTIDIMAVVGNGADVDVLESAGIKEAEMLIAVTQSDEINIIACMMAQQYGVAKKIARIRKREYLNKKFLSKEKLGIDYIINPELVTVNEIVKLLNTPANVSEVLDIANGEISLFGMKIEEDCQCTSEKIKNIPFGEGTLMVSIYRGNKLIIPDGEEKLLVDDRIYVLMKKGRYNDLQLFCKNKTCVLKNVIIFGGSNIGIQIASLLSKAGIITKIIEINKQKCEEISEILPDTLIINGDGTNIDLLKEENIDTVDGFVAVTGYDEENLLVSLLAKHLGSNKVIAKISRANYIPILKKIGIDAVVNQQLTTTSAILDILKKEEGNYVALLKEGESEIAELVAQKRSRILNKSLDRTNLPKNTIIGAIIRNEEVFVPHGDDFIEEGDRVILFTKSAEIKQIEQLFYER